MTTRKSGKPVKSCAVKLVIDASVSLKSVLGADDGEQDVAKAESILAAIVQQQHLAIQPPHWFAEVLAVIALKRPQKLEEAFNVLQAVPHEDCGGVMLYRRAESPLAPLVKMAMPRGYRGCEACGCA